MNQICKVCGEPAAGFHFGAFTCEGCKSFFGRTYNNLSSIGQCKNNYECTIDKKNRTACKSCRLRKCLSVGMSKSGSRYGRRSNWFKIHCLLEEQSREKMDAQGPNPAGLYGHGHFLSSYPRLFNPSPLLSPDQLLSLQSFARRDEIHSDSGESSTGDHDEETRSSLSYLRQSSSNTTPSPNQVTPFPAGMSFPLPASPVGSHSSYSPPVTSTGIFYPPHLSPNRLLYPHVAVRHGIAPANPLLASWPPPGFPPGNGLLVCSPAVGGEAVEQVAPIDLSVKPQYNTPPTSHSNSSSSEHSRDCHSDDEDELTLDVERCSDELLIKNKPIDLTAKRLEVPQSG